MKQQLIARTNSLVLIFLSIIGLLACGDKGGSKEIIKPELSIQKVFDDERFPNVVVAKDGTVVLTWGNKNIRSRRSEDGGDSWGPEIQIVNPGFQGGGTLVDDNSGDILAFIEESHPISPLMVFRSENSGKTWFQDSITLIPDSKGNTPSMHMNEAGITLKQGKYAGRLIRPSRYYGGGNDRAFWDQHYTNAIYSDDGGKIWKTSEPFPANGTGEATLAELRDGTIYYNSRRHKSTDGLDPRKRHIAWSKDGGHTWENLSVSEELPDGDLDRDYGLMGGLVRLPYKDQDVLLFSNIESPSGRHHGTVWASFDGGKSWPVKRLVEEGSFAYSSMTAGRKGTPSENWIYLFYESDGGAKVARFNIEWVLNGKSILEFITE